MLTRPEAGVCAAGPRGVGVTLDGKQNKTKTYTCCSLPLAAAPLSSHGGNTHACTHISLVCHCIPACHHGNSLKLYL